MLTEREVEVWIAENLGNDWFIGGRDEGRRQNRKKMSQELHDLELWGCELI